MRLRDRLRRWLAPAQWADDHPRDASARIKEPTQTRRVWQEAQKARGAELSGGASTSGETSGSDRRHRARLPECSAVKLL